MKNIMSILTVLLAAGTLAFGQQPDRERPAERGGERGDRPRPSAMMMRRDPMLEHLFTPELLRRFADELKLTEEQKSALKQDLEQARAGFEEKEKKVRQEAEALAEILKQPKVDEAAAVAQLDKVLAAEEVVKKARLLAMLRAKNILTPEQQQKLAELRKEHLSRPSERPQRPRDGATPKQ